MHSEQPTKTFQEHYVRTAPRRQFPRVSGVLTWSPLFIYRSEPVAPKSNSIALSRISTSLLKVPPRKRWHSCERLGRPLGFLGNVVHKGTATSHSQRLLRLFPKRPVLQLLTSRAASQPASPSHGANRLSHLGALGYHSYPQHRKLKPSSDRKLGRAAGPSGSTCALGHNGHALPSESVDLAAGCLHVVSLRLRFGGFWLLALPGPLRGRGPSGPVCSGRGLRTGRGLSGGSE